MLYMIELRTPGAYLLSRAWWFLAPLATATTLAALMSAWTAWAQPLSQAQLGMRAVWHFERRECGLGVLR